MSTSISVFIGNLFCFTTFIGYSLVSQLSDPKIFLLRHLGSEYTETITCDIITSTQVLTKCLHYRVSLQFWSTTIL